MLEINPSVFPEKIGHFFIEGLAGKLETLSAVPSEMHEGSGVAIICHPNPLQEGTMTNKVVHTLANAYLRCGIPAVRFNYRGVGKSEGEYGNTLGEIQDLEAIIQWVFKVKPNEPLWLAGFSFGAFIAASGAKLHAVKHLISVAPAVHLHPYQEVEDLNCPWMIIQGDADDVVSFDAVSQFYKDLKSKPKVQVDLVVLKDVGHFFHGRLIELREIVERTIQGT